MNYDRYIKIEVDFDASLDEEFNVPTSKQRVDVSERIWEILKENGVDKALDQLRKKFREEKAGLDAIRTNARRESAHLSTQWKRRPSSRQLFHCLSREARGRGKKRLEQEAEKRAVETGRPHASSGGHRG